MVQHSQVFHDILNKQLNIKGKGLEVAPYFDPCFLKSQYDVMYTDYIGNDIIAEKAAANADFQNQDLPYVDFVWVPGEPLKQCAPDGMEYDYAIASHVMEHVPNPIGWLNDILSVVKVGGKVAIFLPQRQYTFDCFRQETQFYQLVQWWMEQPSVPTPGQLLDFMSNSIAVYSGNPPAWDKNGQAHDADRAYTDSDALSMSTHVYHTGQYVDAHCSVWNSKTFEGIFRRLIDNDLLNVSIDLVKDEQSEFMAIMTKLGEPERLPPAKK
jgi:Methyltransferase domain